jgi:hypothetical protein
MDQTRKDKIKQVMIDTLTKNVNYPNCTVEVILQQLKPMWLALEEAKLTEGLNYQEYVNQANNRAIFANIQSMFNF